jgi:DNA-binding NtrC family response regulator
VGNARQNIVPAIAGRTIGHHYVGARCASYLFIARRKAIISAPKEKTMKSILIVDPDQASSILAEVLVSQGCQTMMVQDARTALSIMRSGMEVDLVVSETALPDMDGIDFLAQLRRSNPCLPIIVVTAHCSIEKYLQAASLDVAEYLTKPLFIREFCRIVRNTLGQSAACRGREQGITGETTTPFLRHPDPA